MDFPFTRITKNAQETQIFGQEITDRLRRDKSVPNIFCLYGNLGSGKTTFTRGLARGFGLNGRLLSPTFIIVRRYHLSRAMFFYHCDLYRIEDTVDMGNIGLEEILHDDVSIIVIEWPEKLGSFMPQERVDIHFSVRPDGSHQIHGEVIEK